MDHEQASEAGETGYLKLPWLLVAGALVVLLGAALAVGLLANRSLREQVALATPTVAPLVAAAPTSTAVPATSTPVPATSTPVAATATPVAVATAREALSATAQPALTPTPRPTVDPALADEVSAAYEHYWDVRAQALFDLDESHLGDVMAGDHLATITELVAQLRSEGRAIQTNVQHHYGVVEATQLKAKVADQYTSESIFLDLQTGEPVSQPTDEMVSEVYELENIDGTWRVTNLARS